MTQSAAPPAPAVVTVHWNESNGVVAEVLPAEIRELFKSVSLVPGKYAAGGQCVVPRIVDLTADIHGGDRTGIPNGIVPAVIAACRRAGHPVRVTGYVPGPLPTPDLTRPAPDPALLALVRAHPGGVVRYGPSVDPVSLVAQVAAAWPDLTIAVVVRRVDDTLRVRSRLRELGVDAAAASGRYRPAVGEVGRVVVTTPIGLAADGVRMEWRQVAVVIDPVDVMGKRGQACIDHLWRARAFGLVPSGSALSPWENDLLAAFFGLAELTLPAHGRVERRVVVESVMFSGGVRGQPTDDPVDLERRGIWGHSTRNDRIAELARLQAAPPGAAAGGVVVLVGGVDHALALLDHLPGWPVVTAGPVNTTGLSPVRIAALTVATSPFSRTSAKAIVTAAALPDLDLNRFSVLVRADAGPGLPPIRPPQLSSPADAPPLRLIDLADRHHPRFRLAARTRRTSYTARGWYAPGVDQLAGRIDRFLATRPALPGDRR
ncbi:MAG: hypothetical protein JWO38_1900 [Gemmataceae bacterium]|nr:hypothetical protein [Gemmataceae bacterium]